MGPFGDFTGSPGEGKYARRVFYGRKLEPKNRILHGAGQSPDAFAEYCEDVGDSQSPMIDMFYLGVSANPKRIASRLDGIKTKLEELDGYVIPQIGLHLKGSDPKICYEEKVH